MIEQLKTEIEELSIQVQEWCGEIEQLQDQIEEARIEIADKEAKIEELQETRKTELLEVIQNAGLTVEQLEAIVSSLQNGETPTTTPSNPTVLVVNDGNQEEYELTEEMRTFSFITVVGTSHQRAWEDHNFVPEIGDIVELSKETPTSNCYAHLSDFSAQKYPELGEDITLGVLPTNGSDKVRELIDLDLPHVTHQEMWADHFDDLNSKYVVTGVVPGKFITLNKTTEEEVTENIEETVAEVVSQINSQVRRLHRTAASINEAKSVFESEMPDYCEIDNIVENGDVYIVNYCDHSENHSERYYKSCEIEMAEC